MTRKLAYCGWLLSLGGNIALAQTHPPKQPGRQPPVVKQAASPPPMPERWMTEEREPYPYLPEDFPPLPAPQPRDPNEAYTYVEQMPTLHGHGSVIAIGAAIRQLVVMPPAAPAGHVFVQFEVTKAGLISQLQVVRGLRADLDSAVLVATRQLPRFAPGRHGGQVVAVRLTLAVTFADQP